MTKVAVAVIHGVGAQGSKFAEGIIDEITARFAKALPRSVDEPEAFSSNLLPGSG